MRLFSLLLVLFVWLSALSAAAQSASVPTASPRFDHLPAFASKLVKPRQVDVWLPAGYPRPGYRYPVLYLHDGQNLFDPKTSYAGAAWEMDSALTTLIAAGQAREAILVGVWNTDLRFREYCPAAPYNALPAEAQQHFQGERAGTPLADDYLRFLVTELKPYIDQHYVTSPRRADTFIAGSSMGGLISLYAALEYPQVFGGAACLSTHWPLSLKENTRVFPNAMLAYLHRKLPRGGKRPKLYFDYGTATLDARYPPHQARVDSLLRSHGYTPKNWQTRRFSGAAHHEPAWRQRAAVPLSFLLAPR